MEKNSQYKSDRLTFRGINKGDAALIVKWRSKEENYRYFFNAHAVSLDEHLAWYNRYLDDKTRYDFMIIDGSGTAIGTVGLSSICTNSCEISYMIGRDSARGKGYAKEAVKYMAEVALSELCVKNVFARIIPANTASIHVVEGVGFSRSEVVYSYSRSSIND